MDKAQTSNAGQNPLEAPPRAGYTLPVFACAAAIAALRWLNETPSPSSLERRSGLSEQAFQRTSESTAKAPPKTAAEPAQDASTPLTLVRVDLINPDETVEIPVEQVARLGEASALAIARSDPGDNLDLTRHTPIWAWVQITTPAPDSSEILSNNAQFKDAQFKDTQPHDRPIDAPPTSPGEQNTAIRLWGGEGIGRQVNDQNQAAIYRYARQLLHHNVERYRQPGQVVDVTFILPEGRALALRTSNAAFGVVDGLSLLGTSGISQPLSAPGQLQACRETLRHALDTHADGTPLVFCIGENGLHLAQQMGIEASRLIKTANWIGPLLAEAGLLQVASILLFGYHGKLLKLAGGIFHTHHHVADGRQEVLTAACVQAGLPLDLTQRVLNSPTAEAALTLLRSLGADSDGSWVDRVYRYLAETIDRRSHSYIQTQTQASIPVGSLLFDRQRQVICTSPTGATLLTQVC